MQTSISQAETHTGQGKKPPVEVIRSRVSELMRAFDQAARYRGGHAEDLLVDESDVESTIAQAAESS